MITGHEEPLVRMPTEEADQKPTTCISYQMSPEEIDRLYGPPLSRRLPVEKHRELILSGKHRHEIAEMFSTTSNAVRSLEEQRDLLGLYGDRNKEEVTMVNARELLPKEKLESMRNGGMPVIQIAKTTGLTYATIYALINEYGLPKKIKQDHGGQDPEQNPPAKPWGELTPAEEDKVLAEFNHPEQLQTPAEEQPQTETPAEDPEPVPETPAPQLTAEPEAPVAEDQTTYAIVVPWADVPVEVDCWEMVENFITQNATIANLSLIQVWQRVKVKFDIRIVREGA